MRLLEEINDFLTEDEYVEPWEDLENAMDLLKRAAAMLEDLTAAFNCEGCRGPHPLCHITGEHSTCNRRPYYKG